MQGNSAKKIRLNSFDDLFGNSESASSPDQNGVVEVALAELHPFHNHPFKIREDERLEELAESIRKCGVLMPGIVRPRPAGGYEIVAGHTRKRACELAGKTSMPVYVRDYSDDEATVVMVDTNIQREDILPSEKARAYRMKYDAMKHQGCKAEKHSLDELGEAAGESGKTVQRYIWLSRLIDELLDMLDSKELGIAQGIDVSFLKKKEQQWVCQEMAEAGGRLGLSKSSELKKCSQNGTLTPQSVRKILGEEEIRKPRRVTIKESKLQQYFPEDYSSNEIEDVILTLLDRWKNQAM